MSITATEFKMNLGKYLSAAFYEDIYITQYGKTVAVLTSPQKKNLENLASLKGFLGNLSESDIDNARFEGLAEKCGF